MIEIRNNLNGSDLELIQSSSQKSISQDLSRLYIKKRLLKTRVFRYGSSQLKELDS